MKYLALDIGKRRTGVAYFDDATGIPLPLDTLKHTSVDELLRQVKTLSDQRSIDEIVVGLPLLPSGKEGEQAAYVRDVVSHLTSLEIPCAYHDERYTTDAQLEANNVDGDAAAACAILTTFLKC